MRKRFHNLKRPKVRADWNKVTLYNLFGISAQPRTRGRTFFQQKWSAKAESRAYHGEQIREGQWSRMFDRRLPSVVPIQHSLLARTDGSEQAAGRGSGLTPKASDVSRTHRPTPYMHMTYWPTERRLDTAVWRSLFASSVRQARQFVVHGSVTVNGKKMRYPGYLLNPGDLFSVEPEQVMYATGARKVRKDSSQAQETRTGRSDAEEEGEETAEEAETATSIEDPTTTEPATETGPVETTAPSTEHAHASDKAALLDHDDNEERIALRSLLQQARSILDDSKQKSTLSGKRKEELREFAKTTKKTLARFKGTEYRAAQDDVPIRETVQSLESTLAGVIAKIPAVSAAPTADVTDETTSKRSSEPMDRFNAQEDARLLHQAILRAQENPVDVTRPYATPWQPRAYMSAFAFIPRYLEVNQKICSAVYLRHPVARPGLAEVPTPFAADTMQLAHNWYLRRR